MMMLILPVKALRTATLVFLLNHSFAWAHPDLVAVRVPYVCIFSIPISLYIGVRLVWNMITQDDKTPISGGRFCSLYLILTTIVFLAFVYFFDNMFSVSVWLPILVVALVLMLEHYFVLLYVVRNRINVYQSKFFAAVFTGNLVSIAVLLIITYVLNPY